MAHIEMFDPRLVALMGEVRCHPELVKKIAAAEEAGKNAHSLLFTFNPKTDENIDIIRTAEEGLAFLAGYVGILVDGDYLMEDLLHLCDIIREKLEEKRVVIINSPKEGESANRKEARLIVQSDYKH